MNVIATANTIAARATYFFAPVWRCRHTATLTTSPDMDDQIPETQSTPSVVTVGAKPPARNVSATRAAISGVRPPGAS